MNTEHTEHSENSFLDRYFEEQRRAAAPPTIAPLTLLASHLRAAYPGADVPPYARLRERAADGKITSATQIRGVWHFRPADLPRIAADLGLAPAPVSAAA